ncbi:MAG: peptide chain release factor N(5)-glutamine methyltransferase [Clostridia bacterium]|nr:peptide chain release factor N(5)-glutamine methyltransferase [Clostridia bacterium]
MVNSYQALLCEGAEALSNHSDTARLDAEVLLAYIIRKERVWFAIHSKEAPDEKTVLDFQNLIKRRKSGEPVAYITGTREFMGLPFKVKKGILIPRPDTETLVEAILNEKLPQNSKILDLCTGSGAIAVSLAYYMKSCSVCAVDISDICIKTATENAEINGVLSRVEFRQADILSDELHLEKADVLVSNPPYIESAELADLMKDVKDFEPSLALDGGNDGLVFYRKIISLLPQLLNPGGLVAFEVGHNQADSVCDILKEQGCTDIKTLCDLAGIRRVVMAHK